MDGSTGGNPLLKRERVRVYRACEDDTLTAALGEIREYNRLCFWIGAGIGKWGWIE